MLGNKLYHLVGWGLRHNSVDVVISVVCLSLATLNRHLHSLGCYHYLERAGITPEILDAFNFINDNILNVFRREHGARYWWQKCLKRGIFITRYRIFSLGVQGHNHQHFTINKIIRQPLVMDSCADGLICLFFHVLKGST